MAINYIKGIIDRIEGQKAILSLDDGQKLNWPIEKLPPDCVEGSIVILNLNTGENSGNEDDEKNLMAKNILNEILNIESET